MVTSKYECKLCFNSLQIMYKIVVIKWAIDMLFITLVQTVIVGEVANFVAYVYAPAVLVTPLGALSIIIR